MPSVKNVVVFAALLYAIAPAVPPAMLLAVPETMLDWFTQDGAEPEPLVCRICPEVPDERNAVVLEAV